MDPLTQGLLGASAPMSVAKRRDIATVAVLGFLSGMSPDLDVLIQSPSDPLLFLEFHRQFTHSFVFIPIGGLICAMIRRVGNSHDFTATPGYWKSHRIPLTLS